MSTPVNCGTTFCSCVECVVDNQIVVNGRIIERLTKLERVVASNAETECGQKKY